MKRTSLLSIFFLSLFSSITLASIERCKLDSILGAVRTLQGDSSRTLGKVCTILEKVCDLQSTASINVGITLEEILEKVCTIEDTTSLTLEKVCNIQITDSLILEKVCDIQSTISTISTITSIGLLIEKICDIQIIDTQILEKVCNIQITDSLILEKVCDIQQSLSVIETFTQFDIILEKVCDIQTTTTETLTKVCTILDTDTQILDKVCDIQTLIVTMTVIPIILDKVCTILDTDTQILEKVCSLEFTVSTPPCNPIPIFSAQTISVPGIYCLANNIAGQITIASSEVDLDLNRHRIFSDTNGVVVNSGLTCVSIRNGIIGPVTEDGIRVNANASNIMIEKVKTINCGITGINLNQANNSSIEKCDLRKNTTGLSLDQSYNVRVNKCRALCNALVGYSLLSSNTNIFRDCKAINTGEGATGDATDVFGFRSFSGFGNIFEHCIANSTQALTTTVQDGIAAGFALTGTEVCSKIINCEASNATTNPDGLAIPYGILLESRFDSLVTNTFGPRTGVANSVNWSPDGRFFARGGPVPGRPFISQFTGARAVQVSTSVADREVANSVNWSPDGKFLAIGFVFDPSVSSPQVNVFRFVAGTPLVEVASALSTGTTGDEVNSVDWSPDGKFLAVGGSPFALSNTRVFKFNGAGLDEVATALLTGTDTVVNSVDWSPDGKFLAVGGSSGATNVYQFNSLAGSLTLVAAAAHGAAVNEVNWSPNGKFLAIGGPTGTGAVEVRVFRFTGTALIEVATVAPGATVNSVNWSPDGKFLAIGLTSNVGVRIFRFLQTALMQVGSATLGVAVNSVDWSPDGSYLLTGLQAGDPSIIIFNALEFPSKNLIKNNEVYCNAGNTCPAGVGLSGSSLKNCILGNTAYENVKNYEFVTNVVNEEFNTLSLTPTGIEVLLNVSCNEINLEVNQ